MEPGSLDPDKVLFSVPTVSDDFPPVGLRTIQNSPEVLAMREDDWRQIEYVSAHLHEKVRAEISAIEKVVSEQSVTTGGWVGYRDVHARTLVASPLRSVPTLGEVRRTLRFAPAFSGGVGVNAGDDVHLIDDGAAWDLGAVAVYAHAPSELVSVLGLMIHQELVGDRGVAEVLAALGKGLLFVDWCNRVVLEAEATVFERYLRWLHG